MACRLAIMWKRAAVSLGCRLSSTRCNHVVALPAPLDNSISCTNEASLVLPEFDQEMDKNARFQVPRFSFGGSMELMAVPKKKVSRHKRGIRNGPRALKPIPVIIRCKSCGRVKLPHFFCCSGRRGEMGENESN